ncbi:hypothetical protein [Paraburkholderia fungorum]|uniref:hypothetical protein n=1 Tax=Paraburkholderia fungorum TaxID=134537 RepID=UPI0016141E19|nr:hypothetical protein [Paraburkholderia fungorum]MBB5546648.1 hypothetical protein [Paraburkholderia fungorum]
MNLTMIISMLGLAIALASLWFSLTAGSRRERVQIEISSSTYLDSEGKERVSYSFGHGHPKTVLDRFRIEQARRRFDRLSRDNNPGA